MIIVTIYPPNEHRRIANEISKDAPVLLKAQLSIIFGTWPSIN